MKPIESEMARSEALALARERLEAIPRGDLPEPGTEAEWLLLHALGIGRAALWAEPNARLDGGEAERLEAFLHRRESREPIQLILGEVPFHGVSLAVEPGVLIPRPETEALVGAVHRLLDNTAGTLLDWGTGTGAIAIALLQALPEWRGVAADRSPRALALAGRNAARNGVSGRLSLVEADYSKPDSWPWSDPAFDLVVSNPPYVRRGNLARLMPEVRDHDPAEALDGGVDGLDAHRQLALGLPRWLRAGGVLALEIGSDQADEVLGLFRALIQDARVLPDWAGRPRIVIGTMRGERA
jgi:release factor glutamine methyltransferase